MVQALSPTRVVGQRIPRADALGKVTGQAQYADDLSLEGMVFGKVLRSPYPHARIRAIDVSAALAHPGVLAVLTADDIPGERTVGPIIKDQPILCWDEVRYVGDAVALVAAETEQAAEEALGLVRVDYEELPAVLDPLEALEPDAPKVHPGGNVGAHPKVRRGDVEAAFGQADAVVEGRFTTQRIEHAYIEPEVAVAALDPLGGLTVWCTTQYPHQDREEVARMLGLPQSRVRVIQMVCGGAFGGKLGAPLPQCYAALIAWGTRRPAKVLYTRQESIVATSKRHPYVVDLKLGAARDGTLVAARARIVGDTGAYLLQGRSVLTKSATHGVGPYFIPNLWIDAYAVFTHTAPCGAMRGYGVPQVAFACEGLMDELASRLGLSPVEIRLRNALDPSKPNTTGKVMKASVPVQEMLRRADRAVQSMREAARQAPEGKRRGVGVAATVHGIGSIRRPSRSTAVVHLMADGSATVLCGHVEMGQGSSIMFAQVVAEALGLDPAQVQVVTNDTAMTPDCEATSATRVTYLSGNAARIAAQRARSRVLEMAATELGTPADALELEEGRVVLGTDRERGITLADLFKRNSIHEVVATGEFMPEVTGLDAETGQGNPVGTYGFATHVALVEVDEGTGQTRVLQYVAINDAGRMVNPLAVEGQVQSGVVMGVGYALTEEVKLNGGSIGNTSFATYQIPTTFDVPKEILVDILEDPEPSGPYGAKGMSEPALDPVGAAIANAVSDAVGVRATRLPLTAERVYGMLRQAK